MQSFQWRTAMPLKSQSQWKKGQASHSRKQARSRLSQVCPVTWRRKALQLPKWRCIARAKSYQERVRALALRSKRVNLQSRASTLMKSQRNASQGKLKARLLQSQVRSIVAGRSSGTSLLWKNYKRLRIWTRTRSSWVGRPHSNLRVFGMAWYHGLDSGRWSNRSI